MEPHCRSEKVLEEHFKRFKSYCKPKSNKTYSRYVFKSRVQEADEPFEQFVTDLKLLIKECSYDETVHDYMTRDHIVFGIESSKVREKLINEGDDINIGKMHEYSKNTRVV